MIVWPAVIGTTVGMIVGYIMGVIVAKRYARVIAVEEAKRALREWNEKTVDDLNKAGYL
jgi:membrane protein YqaA with SNARE-associated domain